MVRRDILGELPVKILTLGRELGNCIMLFLANGKELLEQFSLRDFAMEKFQELSANVVNSLGLWREYHRAAGPSRDNVNSMILEASISATVSRNVELLDCNVDTKA